MNKLLVFLLLTATCAGVAQTATPYASAPASTYPSAPAFTNYIGPWFTITNGGSLFSSNFSVLLVNLEADTQQLLPVLQSLNSSSFLANSNLLASLAIVGYAATNSYLYKATLPGGSTVTSLPYTPATPTSINGTNTATLMARATNNSIAPPILYGAEATNGYSLTPAQQDALRSLIILQNDLERILPVLASLNTGALSPPEAWGGTNYRATLHATNNASAQTQR